MSTPAPPRQLADDRWVAERPQSFSGFPVGTRMTVIRLSGGRLLPEGVTKSDPVEYPLHPK